jgi:hypothetical protein
MYTNYDPNQNYNPYAQEHYDGATVPANSNAPAQGQSYPAANAGANYNSYNPNGAGAYASSAPTAYGAGVNTPEYQNAWSASPPAPYYVPGPVGTPMSQPPAPRRSSTMKVVLIVLGAVLAMMCVIGGIGAAMIGAFASTASPSNPAIQQRSATVVAQTNATATAAAATYPFSAVLKLDDPLSDNSKGAGWEQDSGCAFTASAYHATNTQAKSYYTCTAMSTNFSDFTYQVSMQIAQGDGGALTFRGDVANHKFYSLLFDTTGSYTLLLYTGQDNNPKTLTSGSASGFHTGLGQSNEIGVVARGAKISIYVNGQLVTSVTNSTYTSGQIGVASYNLSSTDVVFSHAKVWVL